MLKVLIVFGVSLAVASKVLFYYARKSIFFVGMIPILMNKKLITFKTIPNLQNKVIIVTGANAGLGKSTAKHLAMNGAIVIMACRSMKKCSDAKNEIISLSKDTKNVYNNNKSLFKAENLIEMTLDLNSFESIKAFTAEFKSKFNKLDSLILNAGVANAPFGLTKDGIETNMGVNHVSLLYSFISYSLDIFI